MNTDHVRELVSYDIGQDAICIRCDIRTVDGRQFFAETVLNNGAPLFEQRNNARMHLLNELSMRVGDDPTKPLPIPAGYVAPEWLK